MKALGMLLCAMLLSGSAMAAVLDHQNLLTQQTFWDNRDWDWYKANIPFFDSPDADINTTYYYRWELVTKHLTYGSPNSGYSFTEFIDRPFWSGAYGSISCPAGHQLYEVRWLRNPRYERDYSRYWFKTPGAQPRRYSTWLADAIWAANQVHPDPKFIKSLLPDLIANYQGWEREHFDAKVGLFYTIGHDDGMEININSRQTQDTVRGAPGFRPTLNAYMYADALAIANVAHLAGDQKTATEYREKAASLKTNMQKLCWDDRRQFFLHVYRNDERRDGFTIKALSKVYDSGQFAGNPHGREEIGFVPWQFNMPDPGFELAWKFLMHRDYFYADFGPTTVERHDPLFLLTKQCCVWSGQSWPYATTQTLKALANLLQNYKQDVISRDDYFKLLKTYTLTQRKNGRPYIAESANPDTGSWEGSDSYNHSEHYFHSNYNDLIITGLVGLKTRPDDTLEIDPLAPPSWDYFALDNLLYRGHELAILWDRTGQRYGQGAGLCIIADGKKLASSPTLGKLTVQLPAPQPAPPAEQDVNFAVNNDGAYYPRIAATFTAPKTSITKLIDGNYWYHIDPPNRWTAEGSPNASDSITLDFGTKRPIRTLKLYFLDDQNVGAALAAGITGKTAAKAAPTSKLVPPSHYELEQWDGQSWRTVPAQSRFPIQPEGHRANTIRFQQIETTKLRISFTHAEGARTGLTEIEAWGPAKLPVQPAAPPVNNLAYNPGNQPFPKITASFTSRFDKPEEAIDGKTNFNPEPRNRWTAYESPNSADWLEIDLGQPKRIARAELALYDDRGGVRPPSSYTIQYWDGQSWQEAAHQQKSPAKPAGSQYNQVRFDPITSSKVRIVFTHDGKSRSGVSEILLWGE